MARDYAQRAERNRAGRKPASGKSRRESRKARPDRAGSGATQSQAGVAFSAPSFLLGLLLGGALVLAVPLAPQLLEGEHTAAEADVGLPTEVEVRFSSDTANGKPRLADSLAPASRVKVDFSRMMEEAVVTTDPDAYPVEFEEPPASDGSPRVYLLQAASFRRAEKAELQRSELARLGMRATTRVVNLDNGPWYRVFVGPYDTRVEAQRVLTRLREKNLSAQLLVQQG